MAGTRAAHGRDHHAREPYDRRAMTDETAATIPGYEAEREEVCAYGREMEDRNLTIHTSGNVSRRVAEGMLITPSNTPYHEIQSHDVLLMDLDGTVLQGDRMPSV